ncbi:hypothetical protein [Streptomyces sp. NPDC048361]|uniref:hypothetical protein n=1 Tax=Streptomyces sp. NPDC048361 TaxID=3154720 RepID=UPI003446B4A0
MSEEQPASGGASGDDAVPDEVWERFIRDSELDIKTSAAPKEPSARARMVTDRLRKEREAAALADTRDLLIDADLNPSTLRGGRPERALALIDPGETDVLARLTTALAKPDKAHNPLSLFSRFDPKEVALVGNVVKTRGRMTFSATSDGGGVLVHSDYSFVYPLVKAAPGSTTVARTIVRRVLDVEVTSSATQTSAEGKLWITRYEEDIANSACGVYDGYTHPHFSDEPVQGAAPSGSAVDPYDRSKTLDAERHQGRGLLSRS